MIAEEDDIYGDGVNIAARLEELCEPGEVLISGTAFDHLEGKTDFGYESHGEKQVKNIPSPVRTYRVLMDPEQAGHVLRVSRKTTVGPINRPLPCFPSLTCRVTRNRSISLTALPRTSLPRSRNTAGSVLSPATARLATRPIGGCETCRKRSWREIRDRRQRVARPPAPPWLPGSPRRGARRCPGPAPARPAPASPPASRHG